MNISAAHIEDGAGTRDFPGPFGAGCLEGLCMTPDIRGVGPAGCRGSGRPEGVEAAGPWPPACQGGERVVSWRVGAHWELGGWGRVERGMPAGACDWVFSPSGLVLPEVLEWVTYEHCPLEAVPHPPVLWLPGFQRGAPPCVCAARVACPCSKVLSSLQLRGGMLKAR